VVYLYVLKLAGGKWYIGKTDHLNGRLSDQFSGKGAEWCKRYTPLDVHEVINNCDDFDEDKYVKKYMSEYGIDNVRGGSYVQFNLAREQLNFLQKGYMELKTCALSAGAITILLKTVEVKPQLK